MDSRHIVRQMLGIESVRRQAILSVGANVGITAIGYLATVYIAHTADAEVLSAYFLFLAHYSLAALGADGDLVLQDPAAAGRQGFYRVTVSLP